MAYQIHILRSEPITEQEWQALCARDQTLVRQSEVCAVNPVTGEHIVARGRDMAIWTAPNTGRSVAFDYRRGQITFVFSDEALEKGKDIASALSATLEGDEGEAY